MKSPYEMCPTFETESFILRLIAEEDAEGLLACYSDSKAQQFFNTDNCSGDFCMYKIEDMLNCIKAWLYAYAQQEFVRFAIVDKLSGKTIGTAEMFGYVGAYKTRTGILRVDVVSGYEKTRYLNEILHIANENFFDVFEVDTIATKASPQAVERRNSLAQAGFCEDKAFERPYYFTRSTQV